MIKELSLFLNEEVLQCTPIVGGYSNLTYLLQLPDRELILRTPPGGAKEIKGGHNVVREFRILEKLKKAGFLKIPNPIAANENASIIGVPFFIMEKVDGTIVRASQNFDHLSSHDFQKISTATCQQLAGLHQINIEKSGLNEIGKPEGYTERQVRGWIERYLMAKTLDLPQENALLDWLRKNIPSQIPTTSMLHNDFKFDNFILNAEFNIKAILDWEMATVGNPLMDLGATLAYWVEESDDPFRKMFNLSWKPGNLSRKEFLDQYFSFTQLPQADFLFYYVFGLFKNAVIIQQLVYRYKMGLTQDARFKNLEQGVHFLFNAADRSIRKEKML